jgi:hypothetical protein
MSQQQRALGPPAPAHPIVAWRRGRLREAGFAPELATQLAEDSRVDLHAVLSLIDRGCRPDLAARILAPLDGESGRF